LIASIERNGDKVNINVKPKSLDLTDDLYHVDNELNAISIEGQFSGNSTLKGKGA